VSPRTCVIELVRTPACTWQTWSIEQPSVPVHIRILLACPACSYQDLREPKKNPNGTTRRTSRNPVPPTAGVGNAQGSALDTDQRPTFRLRTHVAWAVCQAGGWSELVSFSADRRAPGQEVWADAEVLPIRTSLATAGGSERSRMWQV
jgi:hypothetical protein